MENTGTQFDPRIADVFFSVKDQFAAVKGHTDAMCKNDDK